MTGLVLNVITIPLIILIGLPFLIGGLIYDIVKRNREVNRVMRERMEFLEQERQLQADHQV